ncbi:MAG TPA: hypothetical protein VEL68_18765 [Thermodesulfobacteriota bacterium]|nr:hypothetical protein [Thermodesulfobacteriota bacterium]
MPDEKSQEEVCPRTLLLEKPVQVLQYFAAQVLSFINDNYHILMVG